MKTYVKFEYWKEYELDEVEQEQAMLRFSTYLQDIDEYELAHKFQNQARNFAETLYPSTRRFQYHA